MTHATTVPAPAVERPGHRDPVRPAGGGRRPAATALTALGLFLAARLSGVLVLAVVARAAGKNPLLLLGRSWDSVWYLRIAAHGYGFTQHTRTGVHSDLAFFPLYPGTVHAVTTISPLGGGAAGLLVSWTAAAVAACGIHRIGLRLYGPAVAVVLVLLWGLLPHSVVLSMAYTEPVMTAFAAWSLYAVLTRRWVWAGILAALAGLARPNGVAVAAAVLAAAGLEVWRRRGRGVSHRLWTGAALAPLGWSGYVVWVGRRRGDPLGGYFTVQRLWGSRFDFGRGALSFTEHMLLHGTRLLFPMALVIVGVSTVLFALLVVDRAPLPLVVHSGVLLLIALGGSGFFESKPRFLLPAFPLLIVVARALVRTARARPWHAAVVAGALAGLSFVYGAYLVVLARSPL
ncbi:mannosyltransferase family protein [Streptomyces sp. NPDC093984]|uniref:mannosyltransferase family protein n=1 Tax=Streptomyces sp. NPDC093984 TaxID=3366052 RepID=UPI003802A4E9